MGVEVEKRHRINAALWAYAYEIMDDPLVEDEKYDSVCRSIRPEVPTGNDVLDRFFQTEFSPDTGMWIHKHPEADKVAALYQRLTGKPARPISSPQTNKIETQPTKLPFKKHTEMKLYIASLGFKVVEDWQIIGNRKFHVEYGKDTVKYTCMDTGEVRKIAYTDIFTHPGKE